MAINMGEMRGRAEVVFVRAGVRNGPVCPCHSMPDSIAAPWGRYDRPCISFQLRMTTTCPADSGLALTRPCGHLPSTLVPSLDVIYRHKPRPLSPILFLTSKHAATTTTTTPLLDQPRQHLPYEIRHPPHHFPHQLATMPGIRESHPLAHELTLLTELQLSTLSTT